MKYHRLPILAACLAACASSQPSTVTSEVPVARIQMCPDLGLRDVFDCQEGRRTAATECMFNPASHKFLGNIEAASTGVSSSERDVYLAFADRARRLKPDAIIEVRREQRPGSNVWRLRGRAVTFLDPKCKAP